MLLQQLLLQLLLLQLLLLQQLLLLLQLLLLQLLLLMGVLPLQASRRKPRCLRPTIGGLLPTIAHRSIHPVLREEWR